MNVSLTAKLSSVTIFFILIHLMVLLPKMVEAQWKPFKISDETSFIKAVNVETDTFYVSGGKGVYGTFDAGKTWVKTDFGYFVTFLNDMHFFNSKVGIGVGDTGGGNTASVVKIINGGRTWTFQYFTNESVYPRGFYDVDFFDRFNGYAVGNNKLIIKTSDGGNTWTKVAASLENDNVAIKMDAFNHGYIVSKRVVQEFDGQAIKSTLLNSENTLVDIKMIDVNNLIVASNKEISKSSDRGKTWVHFAFPYSQINSMFVLSPQEIYLATNDGVYISRDGGVSWEIFKETRGKKIVSIVFNQSGQGFALGKYGDAFRTDNFGGLSVPSISFDLSQMQYCNRSSLIFAATNTQSNYSYKWLLQNQVISTKVADSVVFTNASSGSLSLVYSNGIVADTLTKSFSLDVLRVAANAGSDVYACSNEPIELSASGGLNGYYFDWSPSDGLNDPKIRNPIATNTNTVKYVVTVTSTGACTSRDTVVVFRNPPVPQLDFKKVNADLEGSAYSSNTYRAIQMVDEKIGYGIQVGENYLYKTTDGGLNWSKTSSQVWLNGTALGDVEFLSADIGYFGRDRLYKTTDGGKTAKLIFNFQFVLDIEFLTPDVGYVITNSGQGGTSTYRTTDGGITWKFVFAKNYCYIDKIKCFASGRCVAIGVESSKIGFWYSDDGIIWKNAIFERKVNAGGTGGLDDRDITFINDSVGFAVDGQNIWKTLDGGVSWKLDYVFSFSVGPANIAFVDDQNGFAASLNRGRFYRTVNGGACWENMGELAGLIELLYVSKGKKIFIATQEYNEKRSELRVADFLQPKKRDQTIRFSIPSSKFITDVPYFLGATASSTLPVTYEVSDESVASINNGILTVKKLGTVQITVKQGGNDSFNPAMPVVQRLEITKAPQSINFPTLSEKSITDSSFAIKAVASSGLPISYLLSDESIASIANGILSIKRLGSVKITAKQAGNDNYNEATDVTQTLNIGKANQTITFAPLPVKTFGDAAFTLSGTSSSGLALTYTSSNTAVATISGNTVTAVATGTCTITAKQAGDDNFNAVSVTRALTINKATQSIAFAALPIKNFGDAFTLSGTSSSGLALTYTSNNAAVVTILGNRVTAIGVGTAMITAKQSGNSNYSSAVDVTQTLIVTKAQQQITFPALADKTIGDGAFNLTGSSNSLLPVSFASTSDKISIAVNGQITLLKAGRVSITASQAGNSNYNAAESVTQTFCIKPAKPTVTLSNLATPTPLLTSSAADGNQWYVNGTAIAGATNATFNATKSGSYKVQVTIDDCIGEFSAEQPLVITGIETTTPSVDLYPNPASSLLSLHFIGWDGEKEVLIIGIDGKRVFTEQTTLDSLEVNISSLSPGVYQIRVLTNDESKVIRFVKN